MVAWRIGGGLAVALLALTPSLHGATVSFAQKPTLAQAAGQTEIAFTLSGSGDVEVAVLDAQGKVVRHLAAGVLGGEKPPPEPLKAGLAQKLTWDGKDDHGKPCPPGGKVRVRAGMAVKFGRMLGDSPYTGTVTVMPFRAGVNGLAVDDQGNLLVKMMSAIGSHGNSGYWPWHLRKFDGQGTYVRTLLPYPASTDPAKTPGFSLLDAGDGALTPANQNSLYGVFYHFGNEMANRMLDGSVVFIHSETRRLNFFKTDGSNALKTVKLWSEKTKVNSPKWLDIQTAFSPDGRFVYLSNVAGTPYDGKKPADIDPLWPQGRIYRLDLSKPDAEAEKFFDLELPDFEKTKYWMPSAWDKKSAAAGIDTGANGNLFVCDLVNQEVVEVSPEGKKLGAIKVPWPDKVLANRKDGSLYVVSTAVSRGGIPPGMLLKFTGRGADAKKVWEMKLNPPMGGAIALDERGPVPALWVAGEGKLMRVEDRGSALAVAGDAYLNKDPNAIGFVGYMDVDAEAELVYVTKSGGTVWRYHGETGAGGPLPIKAVDLAVGPEGVLYTWGVEGGYHGPIGRFGRDLKPLPALGGKATYGDLYGRAGRGSSVCGMDVDKQGRVFATWGSNLCHVRAYGADGNLVSFPRSIKGEKGKDVPVAIDYCSGYGGSLRLDLQGNLYLLQHGLPKGFKPPKGYEKDEAYQSATGTILKFGPEGGERLAKVDEGGRGGDPLGFKGLLALYPGCGPISQWRCDGSCACTKPRFDVDGYGRLYIPHAITFKVSVRDNAGNEIVNFGQYGNFDSQGPASKEPKPAIPLGWPLTAGASDRFIYVGDCLNHRVVRVDKVFAAEESVPVN